MAGQGSTGNVIAAILWIVRLGWLIHLWSIIGAATWTPKPAS